MYKQQCSSSNQIQRWRAREHAIGYVCKGDGNRCLLHWIGLAILWAFFKMAFVMSMRDVILDVMLDIM